MEGNSGKNQQRQEGVGTSSVEGPLTLLKQLHECGVRTAVLCPGGRNAPMIQALETIDWGWEILTFVDERAAAFFALGRIKRDAIPVLVSVTSGTAAAELLPAAIEAHASNLPLVLVTADRPRSHRGSGSPQSMEQVGLFSHYAPTLIDWEEGEIFPNKLGHWDQRSPVHINLCHQEPLWRKEEIKRPLASLEKIQQKSWPVITSAFPKFKKPLVLIGSLDSDESEIVATFCRWFQAPVLAEASSGLRESGMKNLLHSGDQLAREYLKRGDFDGIIRFGGVPSWRIWRDLEFWSGPVLSFGRTQWSGLPGRTLTTGDLAPWLESWMSHGKKASLRDELHLEDKIKSDLREKLIEEYPQAEPSLIRQISIHAAPQSLLYLGNSRPVRDWNEHALFSKRFEIEENRGLNGIDGQVSTFYGLVKPQRENWAVIGDLTALYDLQGPWAKRFISADTFTRLVVINNHGGQIFSRMFTSKTFINQHELDFSSIAKFWNLTYSSHLSINSQQCLIELRPDEAQTKKFRDEWEKR